MVNSDIDAEIAQDLNDLDTENYHRERNGLDPLTPEEYGIPSPDEADYQPEEFDPSGNPPSSDVQLTDKQIKQLQNALDKQKKFNDGNLLRLVS